MEEKKHFKSNNNKKQNKFIKHKQQNQQTQKIKEKSEKEENMEEISQSNEEQQEIEDENDKDSIIDYDNEIDFTQNQEQNSNVKENEDKSDLNSESENEKEEQLNKKTKKAKGFRAFHLTEELYQGIKLIGYKNPTPIQKKIIPEIMGGFNIIAHSRTGSGKTAAFLLPMLSKLKHHSQIVRQECFAKN